jgi:hypothetical protein
MLVPLTVVASVLLVLLSAQSRIPERPDELDADDPVTTR